MLRVLALTCLAALVATGTASGQDDDKRGSLQIVYYTHHECPESGSIEAGSSPDNPINVAFDELWYAVSSDNYDETGKAIYDCRWIRTSGFMTWTNYYHYRGDLHFSAVDSYLGNGPASGATFLVEDFAPGSPVRSNIVRRQMTIVARFYSLCAAANRAQEEAGQSWWLFGPCHYSYNHGLMLSDVRVEAVHDATPQYLTGEANRTLLGSLRVATPAERSEVEPVVRAWAASLQKGLRSFADDHLLQYPERSEDEKQETYDFFENRDSYASYLLNQRDFRRLNLQSAQFQVFRPTADNEDKFSEAVGCVCLEASCTDRWPLIEADADNFLGPAACVSLDRWGGGSWRW